MTKTIRLLDGRSRAFHYALWLLLLTVVALIDTVMDPDLSFLILYVAPVIGATWFLGKLEGYVVCLLSSVTWVIDDLSVSKSYGHPLIPYWNLGAHLAVVVILTSIINALKESVEHRRRLEQEVRRRELDIAQEIQLRLLPQRIPEFETLELATVYRPAGEVGGDYYDWFLLEQDLLGLAVGDVAGKGLAGALLMANLQGMLRGNAHAHGSRVAEFVGQLNRALFHSTDRSKYATLFYCVYQRSDRTLRYTNAGHPPPLLFRRDYSDPCAVHVVQLDRGGPPVGLLEEGAYEDGEIALQNGDLLLVFTDGVTEASDQQEEEFGDDRLRKLVSSMLDCPASKIGGHILQGVIRFAGSQAQSDDITLMVMKVV